MPPRSAVATTTNANGKMAPKGPRAKKEEPKAEDSSVPTIKSQITNPTKASSGKSFLDALRSGQSKRPAPAAAAPPPPPPAEPTVPAASNETGASAQRPAPAPAAVEPEPPVNTATPVAGAPAAGEAHRDAVETAVVDQPEAPVPAPPPHNPVTLPEADTNFSWAHDDDYTFVSEYVPPQSHPQEPEPELPAAPRYNVQYPQEILDAQPLLAGRIAFKAPLEHHTLASAAAALEKDRQDLMEARRSLDNLQEQRQREYNEKQTHFMLVERQMQDDREAIEQERKIIANQQAIMQAQAQAHAQAQAQLQQKQQQQQQQQQQPVSAPPPAINVQSHQQPPPPPPPQQQSVPGYTHSPAPLQWNRPQTDQWRDSMTTTPPYNNNNNQQFYLQNNQACQPYRGKPQYGGNGYGGGMMGRGAGGPPAMGRGNMRPNNHMGQGFNGRPMNVGPRVPNMENGANAMFMTHQQQTTGYMPPQQSDAYGWKQ